MAATRGCPCISLVSTPYPIHTLGPDQLLARAETMIASVIDGLTLPPAEIERRMKDVARQQGVVRATASESTPELGLSTFTEAACETPTGPVWQETLT